MKNSKYCQMTACCWGYRHELLGLILLVIATFLTFVTGNGFGIVAMFLVGGVLCCYKHLACHNAHMDGHCCHVDEEGAVVHRLENDDKSPVKKNTVKAKK